MPVSKRLIDTLLRLCGPYGRVRVQVQRSQDRFHLGSISTFHKVKVHSAFHAFVGRLNEYQHAG